MRAASFSDRAPEVVRVVSAGSNNLPAIRWQLRDISYGKHRTLEADDGERIADKAAAPDLLQQPVRCKPVQAVIEKAAQNANPGARRQRVAPPGPSPTLTEAGYEDASFPGAARGCGEASERACI